MNDPISFAAAKSKKTGDCRDWTPLDMLRELVRRIESGETDPDMVYVAMRQKTEGEEAAYSWLASGVDHLQTLGLLYKHIAWVERDVREDD